MYKAIVNYLCCPRCRTGFDLRVETEIDEEVMEGVLVCKNSHAFRIDHGVADFNSEEQGIANQWESMGEEQDFADLSRDMDARNPAEIVRRRGLVLDAVAGAISKRNCKVVLDIASGRGLMLTELAKNLDDDVHIISIDLSAFVLKHDHRKFKQIAPRKKISYLACDATNLPLKDGVVDAAATYGGFSNMVGCAGEALREAHRVIKTGGVLADSFVVIEKDSKGYALLEQVCSGQNITGAGVFYLHDGVTERHRELFSAVECNVVFEGIGVGNGMDLLPYEGEWYAEEVYISEK